MKKSICLNSINSSCNDVALVLKALSHPRRLLVLSHLTQGERTVSELTTACDVPQSQMSQFLLRLKFEGLVDSRKKGKYRVYFLADKRLIRLLLTIQKEYCSKDI